MRGAPQTLQTAPKLAQKPGLKARNRDDDFGTVFVLDHEPVLSPVNRQLRGFHNLHGSNPATAAHVWLVSFVYREMASD